MKLFTSLVLVYAAMVVLSLSTLAATDPKSETATLAGGCFWCIESDFKKLDGVMDAVSGYAGGDHPAPTYGNYNKPSGNHKIPHIEVIQVTYDTSKLSYKDILEYHMRHIDPTDGDGQFCDRGAGYRPAIFVKNESERKIAKKVNDETSEILDESVHVDILDDAPFFRAEEYHQGYAKRNPARYKFYRWNCGRDQRVQELWGNAPIKKNLTLNK